MPSKKPVQIDDIYRFQPVSDPRIDPAGERVVYVQEVRERKTHKVFTTLWLVGLDGGEPRPLTTGKRHDSMPRWSPDGSRLAFVRSQDQSSQVWLLPMDGGEASQLSRLPLGRITELAWSPRGDSVAFAFRALGSNVALDEKGKPVPPVYRRIRNWFHRLDGEGFFGEEYQHIWTLNPATGRARQITQGPWPDRGLSWAPDGRTLAFIGSRFEDWQYRMEEDEIYLVGRGGGPVRHLPSVVGPKTGLAFSPDGSRLAFIGNRHPRKSWGAHNDRLWTVPLEGGRPRCLTPKLEANLASLTLGDHTPSFAEPSLVWSADGERILVAGSHRGGGPLYAFGSRSGRLETLVDNRYTVVSFTSSRDGRRLALAAGRLERPDEIYSLDLSAGARPRCLTSAGRFVSERRSTPTEEFSFRRGGVEIEGFIQKPPRFSRRRKYPMILYIHGGPRTQYGRVFFHEMHALAAAGYVVVYTNPRGSQGYGEAFADAITGRWAEPAMGDLMAAVDRVCALGYVDRKRLGVAGGSYGGYMVNWMVGHTDRFAAAVTQRSVVDLRSMAGTSDFGLGLEWEYRKHPWRDDTVYRKWSPLTYVNRIRTPLLIIHSEGDLRCNIEQADQLFLALARDRKTVEYIRFPEESHGLSRGGRPDRRVARIELMLEWFDRYLKP